MTTRRDLVGLASCILCGALDFGAKGAAAQGAPAAAASGLSRKILSQTDGPTPGYVTLIVEVTIDKGASVARHTHPGIELTYVMEGTGLELPVQGRETRVVKAGDSFQVPPNTPHAGGKPAELNMRLLVNYIVEKDKPLASPA